MYDLVVVGGGISGLAAAYLFRAQVGPEARILVLDNHDDFGGHAKRNEFRGGALLGYGGSQSRQPGHLFPGGPEPLTESVSGQRFYDYYDRNFDQRNHLKRGILFQRETFGTSRLTGHFGRAANAAERDRWLAEYPVSEAARSALRRLQAGDLTDDKGVDAAFAAPERTHAEEFLKLAFDMPDDALTVLRDTTLTLWGFGLTASRSGKCSTTSFSGRGSNRAAKQRGAWHESTGGHGEEPYIFHFPDGNASIARLLVRSLIPGAVPGSTMEDVVTARARYDKLDRPENSVRVRLNSTAVNVQNDGDGVEVVYVRAGDVQRVRGRHTILACYNNIVPFLCPQMGDDQRKALGYPEKIPLAVVNVALENWHAIADSGFGELYVPDGFLVQMGLDFPVSIGDYRYSASPDQPVVLDCWHAAIDRDTSLHVFERLRRGRYAMLGRSFTDYEARARAQLTEAWGAHGFDFDRDVSAVTVNRWPHGYAWEYTDLWDQPGWSRGAGPHVIGREQLGNDSHRQLRLRVVRLRQRRHRRGVPGGAGADYAVSQGGSECSFRP